MFRRALSFVVWSAALVVTPALYAQPQWHIDVGYIQLINEFGVVADGSGLTVAQVEALEAGTRFLPDGTNAEFTGKTITQGSPGSTTPSTHATNVGIAFYGNTGSIAPGITSITGFDANDWLFTQLGFLSGADPVAQNFAVSNHSYIGNGLSVADATNILQRLDYVVEANGMTTVVGLNNGGVSQPQLNAHAYNVISVGQTSGAHSQGTTTFYGAGRTKPDIVVPGASTSIATARVSSGAAFIYDAGIGTNVVEPEVLKAVMMAGATKDEFPTWDRTTTRPLDEVFGAGEMNVYNSYRIVAGGEFNGSLVEPVVAAPDEGFDFGIAPALAAPVYYDFNIGLGAEDFSIVLAWNANITDTDPTGDFNASFELANMDLRLYDSTGGFLNTLLDSSLSTVDNVEHLFFSSLGPGRYTLEVSSDISHDYGLAWRFTAVPEPSTWIVLGMAGVGFWAVRRRRTKRSMSA